MQTWPKPQNFDGGKFEKRYGLSGINGDFGVTFVEGVEVVYVKDALVHRITDNPPIFEPPDPAKPRYYDLDIALDAAINPTQGPGIDPRIKEVLIELRKLI